MVNNRRGTRAGIAGFARVRPKYEMRSRRGAKLDDIHLGPAAEPRPRPDRRDDPAARHHPIVDRTLRRTGSIAGIVAEHRIVGSARLKPSDMGKVDDRAVPPQPVDLRIADASGQQPARVEAARGPQREVQWPGPPQQVEGGVLDEDAAARS